MAAHGSLATLGVAELLQVAAFFRKMGSLKLRFPEQRAITVYFQDGFLSGLTDSGRAWQLGELLGSLGRISDLDTQRLLTDSKTRGKRLGQLLVDEGYVPRDEMERLLRRLIMQSLLYAVENECHGEFDLHVGAVSQTTVMFPINDFLIEITSAVDELERLRGYLGPGGGALAVAARSDDVYEIVVGLSYRQVQVLAHVDGEKSPMEVTATAPFSPTETLRVLGQLAKDRRIAWASRLDGGPMAPVLRLPVGERGREARRPGAGGPDARSSERVW